MEDKINTEDVFNQFAKAIRLFLQWEEQRLKSRLQPTSPIFTSNPREPLTTASPERAALLRISEAAKILSISKSKLYRMVQTGEIKSVKFGQSARIRLNDLKEFIKEHNG